MRERVVNFFLKDGYVPRLNPVYFEDVATIPESVWQPKVYPFAAALARKLRSRLIVDIGCGRCDKMLKLMDEFDTIGVDYGDNIKYCMKAFPDRKWVNFDLEANKKLDLLRTSASGATVVCSDVIEHLVNPGSLLNNIRLLMTSAAVAVISTPERDETWGTDHLGPPPNSCHVREWNMRELVLLLKGSGLQVVGGWLTQSETHSPRRATSVVICANLPILAPALSTPEKFKRMVDGIAEKEL